MSPIFAVCLSKAQKILWFSQPTNRMRLLRNLCIFMMVLSSSSLVAQYTGVINSNRPGFSESPYSVGTGIYQLETSFFYRKVDRLPTFSRPESTGVDMLFRTSFLLEKLEFNVNFGFQQGQIAFQNIFNSSYDATGIRNLTVGAKYLVYEQEYDDKSKEIRSWRKRMAFDWKRLIPSVAAYVGVNTGIENPVFNLFENGGFSPKVGVLLQNDITRDLNVVTNIFYDRITTSAPELSYIITATYSLDNRWSTFFENQTISNKYRVESNLGSGIAFLWNRNLQLNGSFRLVAEGRASGFYTSFGASYRLDRHADPYEEVDEFGNPIEDDVFDDDSKKKGFFGRIFGKVTGLFKKKSKKSVPKGPTVLKDKTIESIKQNTNKDEQTLNNDTIQKVEKPIRTRPKRVRVKPTKFKKVKKPKDKKKGGLLGIFGGKSKEDKEKEDKEKKKKEAEKIKNMSQKDVDKELRKLDKEQKKLERKQRKEAEKKKREEEKRKKKEKKKKKKDEEKEDENG